jgi:hypothetical protein
LPLNRIPVVSPNNYLVSAAFEYLAALLNLVPLAAEPTQPLFLHSIVIATLALIGPLAVLSSRNE